MKTLKLNNTFTAVIIIFIAAVFNSQATAGSLDFTSNIEAKKFSKDFKVRGWQITNGIYMGHAKIAGRYGIGIVIDKKSYSWGINNRGIAIQKRF